MHDIKEIPTLSKLSLHWAIETFRSQWNSDDGAVMKSKQTWHVVVQSPRPLICLCRLAAGGFDQSRTGQTDKIGIIRYSCVWGLCRGVGRNWRRGCSYFSSLLLPPLLSFPPSLSPFPGIPTPSLPFSPFPVPPLPLLLPPLPSFPVSFPPPLRNRPP